MGFITCFWRFIVAYKIAWYILYNRVDQLQEAVIDYYIIHCMQ